MILSVDSSAVTASAALTSDDEIIAYELINAGLTHSETLLPLIKRVLGDKKISELDSIAVTVGPGSFTGVRIGVATVKGLAFCENVDCIPVSTLEAIAYNFIDENCIVCSVMDARRMQFYNALFEVKNSTVKRLCDDRAISCEELKKELLSFEKVIIAGDGAKLCFDSINLDNAVLADDERRYQNGIGVSRAAKGGARISPSELKPLYLRPSQAERELKLKKNNKGNN